MCSWPKDTWNKKHQITHYLKTFSEMKELELVSCWLRFRERCISPPATKHRSPLRSVLFHFSIVRKDLAKNARWSKPA